MPRHEFGIMPAPPGPGTRYDEYEPERYGCIPVEDDDLLPRLPRLDGLACFWHTPDRPGRGLAYCGVTLIPPEALAEFADALEGEPKLSALAALLDRARREGRYVIHFGL